MQLDMLDKALVPLHLLQQALLTVNATAVQRPWSGFLDAAKKKRHLLVGQQTVNGQTLRSFVSESILDANRLRPPQQPAKGRGSTGMHSTPTGMSQGIALSIGKHVVIDTANAGKPHTHISEDVTHGFRRGSATRDSLSAETAWDRLLGLQTTTHSSPQLSITAAQNGLRSQAQTERHNTS